MMLVRDRTRPSELCDLDEVQLVARARGGDQAAFSVLADRHRPRVYAKAKNILASETAAEDACQETFLQAYRDIHMIREPKAFGSWLLAIAANVCKQQLRSQRAASVELVPDLCPDPRNDFDSSELRADLCSLMQELSPQMSRLAELHYIRGLDQEDIAAQLKVPLGTVSGTLTRARQELKSRFERRQRRDAARIREGLRLRTQGALTISCPLCGRHRLEWRASVLPGETQRLETFCPACSGERLTPITQSNFWQGPVDTLGDGFVFASSDAVFQMARRVLSGQAKCPACSGRLISLPSAASRLARHPQEARMVWECLECRYAADNRVAGILLGSSCVRQFWQEHGAVISENRDERLGVAGVSCWRLCYRSLRRQARLTVVAETSSLDLVAADVDYGRRSVPVS